MTAVRRQHAFVSRGLVCLGVSLLVACHGESVAGPTATAAKPLLVLVSGDTQPSAPVGSVLKNPLIVVVNDASSGAKGLSVNFVVTAGAGSVFAPVVATGVLNCPPGPVGSQYCGAQGAAIDTWTLGPSPGPQTVEARLVDVGTGKLLTEATFHATATTGGPQDPPVVLKIAAGDQQGTVAGTAVAIPPAVLVTDKFGNGLPGISVTFTVKSGSGYLTGPNVTTVTTTTGANGIASVAWTLGKTAGTNTLSAASSQCCAPGVTFTAIGGQGSAARLLVRAGDGQSAQVATRLPIAPLVSAVDANGNGVAGVAVSFAVLQGGGTMDGIPAVTTLTDAGGNATVNWTLGTVAGPNQLSVASLGLAGSPVVFNATAFRALPLPIRIWAGNHQTAPVGSAVPVPPAVIVTDQYNNPVCCVAIRFLVTLGLGGATGFSTSTGANGVATVGGWTLGPTPGTNNLTATAYNTDGSQVVFTANGIGPGGLNITNVAGDGQTQPAGTPLPVAPAVQLTDANGHPVAGITVVFSVTAGQGSVSGATQVTDANGVVTLGSWTLGTMPGTNELQASFDTGISKGYTMFVATGT